MHLRCLTLFSQVVEFCEHHSRDEDTSEPLGVPSRDLEISKWDSSFISVGQEMLFDIILAAHYLEIKSLL